MSPRADSASVEVQPEPLLIFRNADGGSAMVMGRLHGAREFVVGLEEEEDGRLG